MSESFPEFKRKKVTESWITLWFRLLVFVGLVVVLSVGAYWSFGWFFSENTSRDELYSTIFEGSLQHRKMSATHWLQKLDKKDPEFAFSESQQHSILAALERGVEADLEPYFLSFLPHFTLKKEALLYLNKKLATLRGESLIYGLLARPKVGPWLAADLPFLQLISRMPDLSAKKTLAFVLGAPAEASLSVEIAKILKDLLSDFDREVAINAAISLNKLGFSEGNALIFRYMEWIWEEEIYSQLGQDDMLIYRNIFVLASDSRNKELHMAVEKVAKEHRNLRLRSIASNYLMTKSE